MTNYIIFKLVLTLLSGGAVPIDIHTYNIGGTVVIGSGAASGAESGVFENVARNRMAGLAEPSLPADTDLDAYDALVATESCDWVGYIGSLVLTQGAGGVRVLRVIVVDCQADEEKLRGESLADLGLIADVSASAADVWHWRGYLVLEDEHGKFWDKRIIAAGGSERQASSGVSVGVQSISPVVQQPSETGNKGQFGKLPLR